MNSIHDAFLRAGYTPEKERSFMVGRTFLAAVNRSRELKRMFATYPKKEGVLEAILHDYRIFSDGYNAGNTAVSQFKTPNENEQLPPEFIELARILVYPKVVKNEKRAWNFIHSFLLNNEVSGLHEEEDIEPTIENIIHTTTAFIETLLHEDELPKDILEEVNQELSLVYTSLGGNLRGLKKNHDEKFRQLVDRIGERCRRKGQEYDEGKVIHHIQNLLALLDKEG